MNSRIITKFLLITILAVIFAAAFFLYFFPMAIVNPHSVELGHMPDRVFKEYKFKIYNVGLRSITLTKVSTGCTCLGDPIASSTIKPFSFVEMSGRFSSGYRRRALNEVILVENSSVITPVLKAYVSGVISPQILIEPDQVPVGTVQHSDLPISREVILRFENEQMGKDITVNADRSFVSVKITQASDDAKTWIASTILSPSTPIGVVSANIEVLSTKEGWSRKVALDGRVLGNITSNPEAIYLGDIQQGTSNPATVSIQGIDLQNASFVIEPNSAANRLAVVSLDNSNLEIAVLENAAPGIIHGRVILKQSENAVFELPIFGYVLPSGAGNRIGDEDAQAVGAGSVTSSGSSPVERQSAISELLFEK